MNSTALSRGCAGEACHSAAVSGYTCRESVATTDFRDTGSLLVDEVDPRIIDAINQLCRPLQHETLLAQCLKAVVTLEESVPIGHADCRIELAWRIVNALLFDMRHVDTCVRALLAAFPAEAPIRDRVWERRWLTALAVTERIRGNITQSLKAEAAGLSLAQEIGDLQGQASALANLAAHALLSARFDEALQLSELAAQVATQSSSLGPLANAHVIRGNALLYLGRYDDALNQACQALFAVGPGMLVPDKRRIVLAKALAAESLIAMGRAREAAVLVTSAERWAEQSGAWALVHETRRVRALLDVATGEVHSGLAVLRALRKELASETPSLFMDLLQSEYRARTMTGDQSGALDVLRELRSHFLAQAEQTLKALTEAPALAHYLQQDGRLAEIDRYLESKKLFARVVCPATNSWDYLVSLAASSVSPEDKSLEHGFRVGRLAGLVASSLRLGTEVEAAMFAAGLVHDVGKVGVPTELLLKQEPLSEAELAIYDAHTEVGAQLLEQAEFPDKRVVVNAARYHHASFDGLGGQSTVRGEDIPLEARIVSACDAFDGLVTGRPGQPAISVHRALEDIFRRSGRDFDPKVVDALVDAVRRLPADRAAIIDALSTGADENPYFASRRALRRAANPA